MCKIRFWQFRDCGGHIFPWIVSKIRPELKLINVDFVLDGQRNQNYYSDFREVLISFSVSFVLERLGYAINSLPDITKFCVRLRKQLLFL